MNIFNFISILFIILFVITIVILKKKLDIIINRIYRFDRPSLNRNINYIRFVSVIFLNRMYIHNNNVMRLI